MGGWLFTIFNYTLLTLLAIVFFMPLMHALMASLSDPAALSRHDGLLLWPLGFTLRGYGVVFANRSILTGYINTIIYVVAGTGLGIVMTFAAAYVLSRRNVALSRFLSLMILFTMWFNGGLIPTYMVVKDLGMLDTRSSLIIPTVFSVFNFIIMRTSLAGIPQSLEESAKIDGAGHVTIMFRIILPVSKATVAVIALYYAVNIWNSWFNATIYLPHATDLRPLQVVLREILIDNDISSMSVPSDAGNSTDLYKSLVQYATIIVATLPILAIYPFVQKYFVTGVMIGSIKG
jgi:putative aldouronate transport system permease protein